MSYESKLKNKEIDDLFKAILLLETEEECYRFFEDICTIKEPGHCPALPAARLDQKTYNEIEEYKASTATISRVNRCPCTEQTATS